MISCNCFCCVTAPVNNDVTLKTSKRGTKFVQVSLNINYYTGRKENPFANQLFQFALFNETAEKFCEKVSRGDIITVIGLPTPGKPFTTNRGDEFFPIELQNVSWKGYSVSNETDGADTEEDEF